MHPKDKVAKKDQAEVVYKIDGGSCEASYVNKTDSRLCNRVSEQHLCYTQKLLGLHRVASILEEWLPLTSIVEIPFTHYPASPVQWCWQLALLSGQHHARGVSISKLNLIRPDRLAGDSVT